jgi:hypothetical protein
VFFFFHFDFLSSLAHSFARHPVMTQNHASMIVQSQTLGKFLEVKSRLSHVNTLTIRCYQKIVWLTYIENGRIEIPPCDYTTIREYLEYFTRRLTEASYTQFRPPYASHKSPRMPTVDHKPVSSPEQRLNKGNQPYPNLDSKRPQSARPAISYSPRHTISFNPFSPTNQLVCDNDVTIGKQICVAFCY